MPLTPEQLDNLLNSTIYGWDVSSILSGIVDFLEFSENNIAWQREREVRMARREAEDLDIGPQDAHLLPQLRHQIIESAELRFDAGLSQSVRYAGLVAYVTAVEWCAKLFAHRASFQLLRKPAQKNEAVHILESLSSAISNRFSIEINTFRQIVVVRNCIVHSAGLVNGYRYKADLRIAVAALPQFGFSTDNFLGETIQIERGAIESLAKDALKWIPSMDEQCSTGGLLLLNAPK